MNTNITKVTELAKTWDRKSIYSVKGCPAETCAFFVRYVFKEALHRSGIMQVADNRPYYKEHGITSLPTNLNFADGLAGDVVGKKVELNQIQSGDLLLFKDTYYSSSFPAGSITHVGIALNSHGLMADSSSGQCHVRNFYQTFPGKLVEVRRPYCLGNASSGVGITLNKGQFLKSGVHEQLKVLYGVSDFERKVLHKNAGPKPRVVIDNKAIQYQYITVDVALADGKHIKLFHHDGQTSAFVAGHKVPYLNVEATISGGLHVWVEGKEVKPSSVSIGVS